MSFSGLFTAQAFRALVFWMLLAGSLGSMVACAAFERGETEEIPDTSSGGGGGGDNGGGGGGDDTGGTGGGDTDDPPPDTGPQPDGGGIEGPGFELDVHPMLVDKCGTCHSASGMAGSTKFKLIMDIEADYDMVLTLIDVDNPGNSDLIRKGTNTSSHAGGAAFEPGSAEVLLIENWITSGLLP